MTSKWPGRVAWCPLPLPASCRSPIPCAHPSALQALLLDTTGNDRQPGARGGGAWSRWTSGAPAAAARPLQRVAAMLRIPQHRAGGWAPQHRSRRRRPLRRLRQRRCPPSPCTSRSRAWTSSSSTAGARRTRCGRWSGRAGRPRARCAGSIGVLTGVGQQRWQERESESGQRRLAWPTAHCHPRTAGRQPQRQHRCWRPGYPCHRRCSRRGARPAGARRQWAWSSAAAQ